MVKSTTKKKSHKIAKIIAAPVEEQKELIPVTGEIGSADVLTLYGTKFTKYNPDSLIGNKGYDVYRKMMLDDQVKAVVQLKCMAVASRAYYFDADEDEEIGKTNDEQQKQVDLFTYVVDNVKGSFKDALIGILSGLQNGFSITEIIWGNIEFEGKAYWGIKKLKVRPFNTFDFETDVHGNILKVNQQQGVRTVEIPQEKIIHFVHQPDIDEHYGESDLKAAYRSWWSKDIAIKFQNIFLERHSSGFIYAEVSKQLSPAQSTDLKNLLNNISAKMSALVPEGVKLTAFNPMSTDAYEKAIAQHDKAIAKSILVPNLLGMSEQGTTGSYSQSQTHLEAFFWILDSIAGRIEEVLNEQLFKPLSIWNFGTDIFPRFKFEPMTSSQKVELAKAWSEMVSKGAVTKSNNDEAWIRRMVGAPEKSEDAEELPAQGIDPATGLPMNPEDMPQDKMPVDDPTDDNKDWVAKQEPEKKQNILKTFALKPWMKRVNFKQIETGLNESDTRFSDEMTAIMGLIRLSLEQQIGKLFGDRSGKNIKPNKLTEITIPKKLTSELAKTVRANLERVIAQQYKMAKGELPKKQFAKAIRSGMDLTQAEKFFASKSMKITGIVRQDVLNGVQQTLENAVKYDKTLVQTIDAMDENNDLTNLLPDIDSIGRPVNKPARIETIVRTNTADAMNQARQALFNDPDLKGFVLAFEYSAILDDRTTEVCASRDGSIQKDWGSETPPNHFNCRSLLVPVTAIDDWDGQTDKWSDVPPQKGFA